MTLFTHYLLPFLALMGVLVAIHEGGHYLAARLLGIRVTHFAIGMGPTLFSRRDRRGCEWKLCLLPVGGYVRMLGDGDAASVPDAEAALSPEERTVSFRHRPPGHKSLVVAAGPVANLLLGFLLLTAIYVSLGRGVTPPVVAKVNADSPAAVAGLLSGDRIQAVNGTGVAHFEDIVRLISGRPGLATDLLVERAGATLTVPVIPASVTVDEMGGKRTVGRVGIAAGARVIEPMPLLEAAVTSVSDIAEMTVGTLKALRDMVLLDRPLKELGGPVRIAEASGDTLAKLGVVAFAAFAAVVSVNLGVINLLPIPVLDGGHLLLYAIESVRGRPASPQLVARLFRGGAIALLFLFAAITGSDLAQVFSRMLGV